MLAVYLDYVLGSKRRALGSHPHLLFNAKLFDILSITWGEKRNMFCEGPRQNTQQHLETVMQVGGGHNKVSHASLHYYFFGQIYNVAISVQII